MLVHLNQTDPDFPDSHLEVDFDDVRLDASPLTLAGDFDLDGDVDGSDFLLWQREATNHPDSAAELVTWEENYGNNLSTTLATTILATTIPEPTSTSLFAIGLLLTLASAHKKTRRCHEATTR